MFASSFIRPFPKTAVYPTSWSQPLTFEQLYDDLAHYAICVMTNYGILPHQLPDCLQIGMMALWEQLSSDRTFLQTKTRRQAVFFILARCKISTLRYHENQYDRLEPLVDADWRGNGEEFAILGLEANRGERWAAWATHIDLRTDIERILGQFAAKYEQSLPHLVALYALTTDVTYRNAASILGLSRPFRWIRTVVEPLRIELQLAFAELLEQRVIERINEIATPSPRLDAPARAWRDEYRAGNHAPAQFLLGKHERNAWLTQALHDQLDGSRSYTEIARDTGRTYDAVSHYMKRAARLLNAAYA
jgi:hypothetical protein